MNIQEQLLERGYKKHVSETNRVLRMTDTLFQKRVADSKGIRYFINLWWYKEAYVNGSVLPEYWEFEVQYTNKENSQIIDVKLCNGDVDEAEQTFENMWTKLGLGYYKEY